MPVFLALVMLYPMLRNASITIDYHIDKATYLESCINKAMPEMKCDGKCVLAKKIRAAAQEHEPQAPELLDEPSEFIHNGDHWVPILFVTCQLPPVDEVVPLTRSLPISKPPPEFV